MAFRGSTNWARTREALAALAPHRLVNSSGSLAMFAAIRHVSAGRTPGAALHARSLSMLTAQPRPNLLLKVQSLRRTF
jgi:hypothetical protein